MRKNNLILISLAALIILLIPARLLHAGIYSGGSGTSEDPYQIANLNDLQELSTTSADWGMYFEQTASIDASGTSGWWGGTGFSPIGNFNTPFTGTYDGNSHPITNMYIYRPNENQPQGLFGYTENATLISINNESVDITGFHGVGAIVGYAYLTNISFCYSSGNVTGDGNNLGGIAGENMDGMVEHCTSDCNVTAANSASIRVGGLVGYNLYGSALIIESQSRGNVNGYSYTGGLVGDNYGGQINSSKSTSSVTGTNFVGGLIGYTKNASNIKNSYCRGDVTRKSSSTETNIGGYCGYNENSTIAFSYSTGSVYYDGTGAPTDKGFSGGDNGSSDVVYTANFFDSQASNQTTGTGATASNTSAMTDATLYANAGWDGTIWFIDASNDGYAHLEFEDWGGQSITWGVAAVSTDETSNIGTTTAQSGGNVTDEGNSSVTSKGVVWDVTDNPTILSYIGITNDGSGLGSFTSNLTGLSESTTYYVRAYATNTEGTGYGTVKSFTTLLDVPPIMTPPGNALDFDGTDDYVSLNNESNFDFTTTMTIEAWIKVDAFDKDWQAIVTKGDGAWRLHRYSATNHIAFGTSGLSNVDLEGTTDVNDGQWHHVAGVFDGSTKYIYVDGALDASVSATGSITNNNYEVNIAENAESTGRYFNGLIDEIRIWNIARTQTQIQDNKNNVLTGNESGLVAYYKFDQTADSYLYDQTGNNNQGALQNMDNSDWIPAGWPTVNVNWTGATDNDWTKPGNWEGAAGPPESGENAVIPDVTNDPRLESPADIDGLYISDGASLTIGKNGSLTVDGLLSNASGSGGLNIESDATGTGSLIVSGTATGDINVQRYLDVNDKASKWHYVSAPVSGQLINDDFMTNNSIYSPNGTNYNFYRWDEDTDYWIIYGSTGNPEAFNDGSFFAGRGYALSRSSSGVVNFEGSIRTDDASYSATYTNGQGAGWNLVGNPFTSALAVTTDATTDDKFLTNTTNASLLDDNYTALYIWDEGAGYTYGEDDYKVIGNPVLGSYTQIDQDYVQPGQAFMVKVSSSGNLEFNEDMQAHADVGFFKEKETWPHLELLVTGQGLSNTTGIGFHEGMTKGLDPSYDVGKLKGNPDIALYTRLVEDNGIDFAIQALPLFAEDYSVPLGFDLSQAGEYSFEAISMKEIPGEVHIYFEDKQNGNVIDLKKTNKYTCFINGTCSVNDRFLLHFTMTPFGEKELQPIINPIEVWTTNRTINIYNPEGKTPELSLITMLGQSVIKTRLNGKCRQQFNLNVNAGYYVVQLTGNEYTVTRKIFVE